MGKFFINVVIPLFLLVCACERKQEREAKKRVTRTAAFVPAKWYAEVQCKQDTTYTYSLYLPGDYGKGLNFPVIYFFDAHRRGGLPVRTYKDLAEKYGFILAGSNHSANGQDVAEMNKAISMMIDDVSNRVRADPGQMYTGGFSGGARVAAYAALYRGGIAGVAGCAAGFPPLHGKPGSGFVYIGFTGDEDFNYLEMKQLDRALERAGFRHFLVVYGGEHDWPPAPVMKNAFLFFRFDAMRRRLRPVDTLMIRDFLKATGVYVSEAREKGDLQARVSGLKRAVVFLEELTDVGKYRREMDRLMRSDAYKKMEREESIREETEQRDQQRLAAAMGAAEINAALMNEIGRILKASNQSGVPAVRKMNQRLLNYLSLLSYLYAKQALGDNDLVRAGKYLDIYEKVDADNPEVYYLKAVRLARLGQDREVVPELKKAVQYGFQDYNRMKGSSDFLAFHRDKDFRKVLETAKRNQE